MNMSSGSGRHDSRASPDRALPPSLQDVPAGWTAVGVPAKLIPPKFEKDPMEVAMGARLNIADAK